MPRGDLNETILEILREAKVPLYAREVADECGRRGLSPTRQEVNKALHGPLSGRAERDSTYRWSVTESVASEPEAAARLVENSSDPSTPVNGSAEPECPDCGSSMQKRRAQRGPRAGKYFWGCSEFPQCRGAIDIEDDNKQAGPIAQGGSGATTPSVNARRIESPSNKVTRPVPWKDRSLERGGWICRYGTAGGSLRAIPESRERLAALSTCWLARPSEGTVTLEENTERFVGVVRKLLERGVSPPLDPRAERKLLQIAGVGDKLLEPLPGHLDHPLSSGLESSGDNIAGMWSGDRPELDEDNVQFDSDEETIFLTEWAPENLPAEVVKSIIVQPPLEALVKGLSATPDTRGLKGQRRLDFLIQPFDESPIAVEIDGEQHSDAKEVDAERDALLATVGIDVLRVTAAELRNGNGPGLAAIASRVGGAIPVEPLSRTQALLSQAPSAVHRTVLALTEAVLYRLVEGNLWVVEVDDPLDIAVQLIGPYLDLLAATDLIWQAEVMPERIEWVSGSGRLAYERRGSQYVEAEPSEADPTLRVLLESHLSPIEDLGLPDHEVPEVIVRSARLPVKVQDPIVDVQSRISSQAESEQLVDSMTVLLQSVFALESFREGQLDALVEVMQGRSCAVLLPTGAGKSLIYQMAGLCLPGRTIVVDPIIALMEDQVRGLAQNGIDRTVAISSFTTKGGMGGDLNDLVASGESFFTFVSPERLQQQSFRESLRELAMNSAVNVAVVDEAHCVSEWGHDFRTSYLNLGRLLKQLTRTATDPDGPPVLALTGTASRAVLRDVLIELDIERDGERSVIQPNTFDRPELSYTIQVERPSTAIPTLIGLIRSLPRRFGLPPASFFASRGPETASGIVFCPHKNGSFGVVDVAEAIGDAVGEEIPVYAGSAPRGYDWTEWEETKRRNARAFMNNSSPILVSTKAFGMGIDKPNVRYVIHMGIPGSIESYYQEVGRAGRDREKSECVLLVTEYDESRNRSLLEEDLDLELVRTRQDDIGKKSRDDVSNQLYFLLNSFVGESKELGIIEELLDEFGGRVGTASAITVPMGKSDEQKLREKGLHRLVMLGVLRDYTVDWGGKSYEADLLGNSASQVAESLFSFVRRSQPGRVESIRNEIGNREGADLRQTIVDCSRTLISFVYDTIERSRRRSLREMWLAAREGKSDPDGAFRERILDYLTQGAIAPKLEKLVDRSVVDLSEWRELLEDVVENAKVDQLEPAAELRGGSARLLTSSPDHPGLLLARSLSEMLLKDGELEEVRSGVESAIRSSDRYEIERDSLQTFLRWMADESIENAVPLGVAASIVIASGLPSPSSFGMSETAIGADPDLTILEFTSRLEQATNEIAMSSPGR